MRRATKILLLISEIFSWIAMSAFFICSIVFLIIGIVFLAMGESQEMIILGGVYLGLSFPFLALGGVGVAASIIGRKTRYAYVAGGEKADFKKKAITLIVLGALVNEIAIVPSVFMLIQKEHCFKD